MWCAAITTTTATMNAPLACRLKKCRHGFGTRMSSAIRCCCRFSLTSHTRTHSCTAKNAHRRYHSRLWHLKHSDIKVSHPKATDQHNDSGTKRMDWEGRRKSKRRKSTRTSPSAFFFLHLNFDYIVIAPRLISFC